VALLATDTQTRRKLQRYLDGSSRRPFFEANPAGGKGSRNVNKTILNFGHFDVWDYGSNVFNGDILFSNANEPAANSSGGSTEFYGVYRGQLSPDKIFGINTAIGPFSAINFEFGGDANTENSAFGPNKKLLLAGPNFHRNMPAGFLTISVHVAQEWTHNGFSSCPRSCGKGGPIDFDPTAESNSSWLYPLGFTVLLLDFRGLSSCPGYRRVGSHTYTEILARPQLQLEVGKIGVQHAAQTRRLSGSGILAPQVRESIGSVRIRSSRSDSWYRISFLIGFPRRS
jgi:hypothetical protein